MRFEPEWSNYAGQFYSKHWKKDAFPEELIHCQECGWHPKSRFFGKRSQVCCRIKPRPSSYQMFLTHWSETS